MLYQLLLPHIHRRNTAKQAMETWKDNFFEYYSVQIVTYPYIFGVNS